MPGSDILGSKGQTITEVAVGGLGSVLTAPLIPALGGGACDLNNGYLDGFDYFPIGLNELCTIEMICMIRSGALTIGQANAGAGILLSLYSNGITVQAAGATYRPLNVYSVNQVFHVIAVMGGYQSATPDYYSRLYVNGVDVGDSLGLVTGSFYSASRFEIGSYANGSSGPYGDAIVSDTSLYSRMLQPAEVLQRAQALGLHA
jgi:hypothetical protein